MKLNSRRNPCLFLLVLGISFLTNSQTLNGKIVNDKNVGIKGALVKLANAGLSVASGDDGSWSITVPTSIEPFVRKCLLPLPILKSSILYFSVNDNSIPVIINVFSLNGRLIHNVVNQKLAPGFYSFDLLKFSLNPNLYVIHVTINDNTMYYKVLITDSRHKSSHSSLNRESNLSLPGNLEKRMVIIDTVKVSKAGYDPAAVPISSYLSDPLTITLKTFIPAYHLNPPNPCYNKFVVDSCIPGDTNSACRGNCRVANACSPPEDASKANLPKTFICPRFMLFSTEMLQAAKDDAALYGWGDSVAPFNYAVVGHDPDVGGVDDQQSSCCQCYQIVYAKPEPSSPQPPDLPYPRSLVVQSFNTAASGAKGFDVFMAAGGYGAFNACYKDAAFGSTTKFNEFIYDNFPYQNPGSGGISFLRYQECIKGWPPTVDGVLSSACQDIIKQMCDQALVKSSTQITDDTRYSCIQTNQLASLYHQNWDVMVKRIRCPENLTRVTGCRLKEDQLPLPLPAVQTPMDAKTNGTFRDGYHTTTMQDCCKPTCAWTDWTVGHKLPVDGEWNSFYSCDKNGVPITK